LHEIPLPSVGKYADALERLAARLSDNERAILKALLKVHHAAPGRVISATKLADRMRDVPGFNFPNYNTVNLRYGELGRELAKELQIPPRDAMNVGIFVDFVPPDYCSNTEYLWVLKQNVSNAIEQLGWAEPVSDLLYPHEAIAIKYPAARVHGA
jgi:hypothetical protein